MSAGSPRVSVIVPTRDRAVSIERLLPTLAAQRFEDFEVIVVDDGSTDATPAVCAAAGVRTVRTEGVGAVEARCIGVKAARGSILAFTDDDCVVDAEWLQAGVGAIDAGADVAQGRTVPQRPVRPLERTVEHGADDGLFPTCNVFYRRDAYDRAGGFDRFAGDRLGFRGNEQARSLGFGEDTMLGWAVARAGRAAAAPGALVRHEVLRPPIRELFSRTWVAGGFPTLVREVPELRGRLVRRRVVLGRPDARLLAYGLPLLVAGPLAPVGVVVAALWIAARLRRQLRRPGSRSRRLVAFPVDLALDVTMCAALLVGSIRARVLVI